MAGTVFAGELKTKIRVAFAVADETDDAEIRALLRNNPMRGRITISLEREPSFFTKTDFPAVTIVARERGQLVCAGSCSIQQRFVNGSPRAVGYLGGLRLDRSHQGRFDILRRGYDFFRDLQAESPADFYFTSIASDNQQARAFLESSVRRMPKYEFVGEFVTLLLPTNSGSPTDNDASSTNEVVSMINEAGLTRQFAPWLCLEQFVRLGIRDVFMDPNGCGCVWDQRSYKQIVIRDYAPALKYPRMIINLFLRLTRGPLLPAIDEQLPVAFGAFLHGKDKGSLLNRLLGAAKRSGIQLLTVGFDAKDPDLRTIQTHFKNHSYRSRIYVVRWPGLGGSALDLDDRLLGPEVAFL